MDIDGPELPHPEDLEFLDHHELLALQAIYLCHHYQRTH